LHLNGCPSLMPATGGRRRASAGPPVGWASVTVPPPKYRRGTRTASPGLIQ
jgi:hypothetical protein